MGKFITFREIVTRYEAGENAFDLTVEKWVRIRESLEIALGRIALPGNPGGRFDKSSPLPGI